MQVTDLKTDLNKKVDEPLAVSYKLNVCIINILWNLTCGRRLHAQQQEFQTVYECVDKITQFMSRSAIVKICKSVRKLFDTPPESQQSVRLNKAGPLWLICSETNYRMLLYLRLLSLNERQGGSERETHPY